MDHQDSQGTTMSCQSGECCGFIFSLVPHLISWFLFYGCKAVTIVRYVENTKTPIQQTQYSSTTAKFNISLAATDNGAMCQLNKGHVGLNLIQTFTLLEQYSMHNNVDPVVFFKDHASAVCPHLPDFQ